MSSSARSSLGRILSDLGQTLLEPLQGGIDLSRNLGGVVIYDPVDVPVYPEDALVLGVGIVDAAQLEDLVANLSEHRVAALIVRASVEVSDAVRAAVDAAGLALLGLTRGATWIQVAALLRSLLAEGDIGNEEHETLGGLPSGDLFAVANAIAALLDAPVTIEDRSSRVLAFSGRQEEADASRAETILGRQVPERFARLLTETGVFGELYRHDKPVVIEPISFDGEEPTRRRVAMAVRAGDEVLGSIWATMDGAMTPERTTALRDGATLVALHLLRVRAGADVQRRLSTDLVGTALEGGAGAGDALRRLGLAGQRIAVIGAVLDTPSAQEQPVWADPMLLGERQRFADALAVHLSVVSPRSAVALVGDIAYGILPSPDGAGGIEERAMRIAQDFLDRVGSRMPAVVAIGPDARDISGIEVSRSTVDRVLRVLRERRSGLRVARLADVHTQSLLLELSDIVNARGDKPSGPIARLIEYDEINGSNLVQTLSAWLNHFGDVATASQESYVHPNTFRYRLRRLAEVSGLDLQDSEARFFAMLQLRLLAQH